MLDHITSPATPYTFIYNEAPFVPLPPLLQSVIQVSSCNPAPYNSKFDPSVNPANESCDTESCNSVVTPVSQDSLDGRFSKILKLDGRRRQIFTAIFFLNGEGCKITQINTGFVVVDRGDENGRPHF